MKKKKILVTGSGGLVGGEAVRFFSKKGFDVFGIDNNMRRYFFGEEAGTARNTKLIKKDIPGYRHFNADIRDQKKIERIFKAHVFDLVVHTAAQPSHDWASKEPITDFTINANGTLVLLENFRKYSREGVFIFTSTNKVYGDLPNFLPLIEKEKRFDLPVAHEYYDGIDESMSLDQSKHSLFGASKAAADILVQEYGRYFSLNTVSLRCGCLTGPAHSGAEMHGFLAYLGKCIAIGRVYRIFGYKGKQVRDNIHAYDLVNAMFHVYLNPRRGEVYNMGGGRFSNVSILEAIEKFETILGKKAVTEYVEQNRSGDHIWYVSNVSKFKSDYPDWEQTYDLDTILKEICEANKPD